MNGQILWKYSACLAAVAMLVLATTSSAQLLVSFEESEGFPLAQAIDVPSGANQPGSFEA